MTYTAKQFDDHKAKTLRAIKRVAKLLQDFPGGLADSDNMLCELQNFEESVENVAPDPHDTKWVDRPKE